MEENQASLASKTNEAHSSELKPTLAYEFQRHLDYKYG